MGTGGVARDAEALRGLWGVNRLYSHIRKVEKLETLC